MAPASQMPILYDRDCGFCRVSLALVLAWDRHDRLRPVAIQSEEGARLLAELPDADRLASAHAVAPGGTVRSGGAAAPVVFEQLPGGRPLALLAGRAPGLADRGYRAIASRRRLWGKVVPDSARRWADRRIARRVQARPRPSG